jgi:predicted Ser/Thr protein kinase
MPDRYPAHSTRQQRVAPAECVVLDAGIMPIDHRAFADAIQLVAEGLASELARDRNAICYRVNLARGDGSSAPAIVKVPRLGQQRTNPETTFAREAEILALLPAAGIPGAPGLLGRVVSGDSHFLFLDEMPGTHPDPRTNPLDGRQLRTLLDHLYIMDTRGLMHYDLKPANILVAGADVGFVDFEFARFRSHSSAYAPETAAFCADFNVSMNAFFPARSNVANFEFRALHHYLDHSLDHRDVGPVQAEHPLFDWLCCKSGYHRKMAAFLADLRETSLADIAVTSGIPTAQAHTRLGAAVEQETLLAGLFAQPDETVVRAERLLMAYRCAVFEHHTTDAEPLRRTLQALIRILSKRAESGFHAYGQAIVRVLELVKRSVAVSPDRDRLPPNPSCAHGDRVAG